MPTLGGVAPYLGHREAPPFELLEGEHALAKEALHLEAPL